MRNYKFTFIGLILGLVIFTVSLAFNIELFELLVEALESLEKYEIDELIIPIVILVLFSAVDQVKLQRTRRVEREKTKIYKAMLSSTHHILNNFLNQMQLFRMTAEDTSNFDPEVLSLYDVVISDAKSQIETLSNISDIDELSIHKVISAKQNK